MGSERYRRVREVFDAACAAAPKNATKATKQMVMESRNVIPLPPQWSCKTYVTYVVT